MSHSIYDILSGKYDRSLYAFKFFFRDPTPEKEEQLDYVEWPPAQGANFSFLEVGLNGKFSIIESDFYPERMTLWDSISDELKNLLSHKDEEEESVKNESTKDEL